MSARGHVLLEVMISGAVLLFAAAGVVAGLTAGADHANLAAHDQMAAAVAAKAMDQLRTQPASAWIALKGTTVGPAACPAGFPVASCTQTTAVSDYQLDTYGAFPAGVPAARYLEATVTVSVCAVTPCPANARTVTTRALKFLP